MESGLITPLALIRTGAAMGVTSESGLIALFMSASPVNTIPNRWRIRNNLYQAY